MQELQKGNNSLVGRQRVTASVTARLSGLASILQWTLPGRLVVFLLSATSIWSLLAEFYHLCSMRLFTIAVLLPACGLLTLQAVLNRSFGDRRLYRAFVIGGVGGLFAAIAYDLFRLPFVIAAIDRVGPLWLRLPLFKVFPRFGMLILGQDLPPNATDSQFRLAAHLVGWAYHFSNGASFGIMYLALIGDAARRSVGWAVFLAAGLELAMLATSYTQFFGIPLTVRFIIVTLTAHLIFGLTLGLYARRKSLKWPGEMESIPSELPL